MCPQYPTAPPGNNLEAIQTQVRRLIDSPSEAQISTDHINDIINTVVLYDLPVDMRTFNLHKTFSFVTNPYQDSYPTTIQAFGNASSASQQALYDFKNRYVNVENPVMIAGYGATYTQSREEFYGNYPNVTNKTQIYAIGDGATTTFSGIIPIINGSTPTPSAQQNVCYIKGKVLFDSVDLNFNGTSLRDIAVLDSNTGQPTIYGNLYDPNSLVYQQAKINLPLATPPYLTGGVNTANYINYITGEFTITFSTAPGVGQLIYAQAIPRPTSRPFAMLYYDDYFVLRPVPDQPYEVNFQVYARPIQLLEENSVPELAEWWQYIAFQSAKKIFEQRKDMESVSAIMPSLKEQKDLCMRRTATQIAEEVIWTPYTAQASGNRRGSRIGSQFYL